MKPYEKTAEDSRREQTDLKNNAVMRWLQNQDAFMFNVGDVLVKKVKNWHYNPHTRTQDGEWVTEVITKTTNAPKKFVYIFENKLGIGYMRQLKADGSGYCGTLMCVANFDPENTKLELDPDFVDHTIIGDGEFDYNTEYTVKKKFRQDAMNANRKLLVTTSSKKALCEWFLKLKIGDMLWYGHSFDDLAAIKYQVINIIKVAPPTISPNVYSDFAARDDLICYIGDKWLDVEMKIIENNGGNPHYRVGSTKLYNVTEFSWSKVSMTQPHPMKDQLCGPPK